MVELVDVMEAFGQQGCKGSAVAQAGSRDLTPSVLLGGRADGSTGFQPKTVGASAVCET